MIKITDLKGIFNITPNPDHKDWLDISFKEDFCIPERDTVYKVNQCLKVELENEYEEIFIEGAFRNNIEYDVHYGTTIVDDKERILNMYYSTYNCIESPIIIPSGEVHSHIYMAIKNDNVNTIRYGSLLILDNKNIIKSIEKAIELPSNEEYIRIKENG